MIGLLLFIASMVLVIAFFRGAGVVNGNNDRGA